MLFASRWDEGCNTESLMCFSPYDNSWINQHVLICREGKVVPVPHFQKKHKFTHAKLWSEKKKKTEASVYDMKLFMLHKRWGMQ